MTIDLHSSGCPREVVGRKLNLEEGVAVRAGNNRLEFTASSICLGSFQLQTSGNTMTNPRDELQLLHDVKRAANKGGRSV